MESLSGPGALAPLSLMMTGELAFGGIGSGLSSMLLVVLLTVFLAGLLVGRTPEYVGRKLDVRTVKLVVIGTLAAPMLALGAAGLATASKFGRASIFDSGPQGFGETLYAYLPMLAALAVAGAVASKPVMATGRGTLRTDNATFVSLLLAVIVVVVLLTFVPALLLGSGIQGLSARPF